MNKKSIPRKVSRTALAKRAPRNSYARLLKTIASANSQMLGRAVAVVNQALVLRNWLIGAYLVEYEQEGSDRAKYGARLLENLAQDLAAKNLKGLDARALADCRLLFQVYPQIRGTVSPELDRSLGRIPHGPIARSPRVSSRPESAASIRGTVSPELPTALAPAVLLRLSWSKLQELIRIDAPWKRAFFENECLKGNWSKRQLQRQIESLLYERSGLSTNKQAVIGRAHRQEKRETIDDLIRDPNVLEFTGLAERPEYSESDLESALLDHLQRFVPRHSREGGNPGRRI